MSHPAPPPFHLVRAVPLFLLLWIPLAAACTGEASGGGDAREAATTEHSGAGEAATTGQPEVREAPATERADPGQAAPGERAAAQRVPPPDLGHTVGSDRAPVQILEFSDFGCGYCRRFHLETWETLEEEYVETGMVQWTYIPMVLGMFGASSIDAAETAECAIEQGRFPAVRHRLFQAQSRWKGGDAMAVFRQIADEAGLDLERWEACMADDRRLPRIAEGTQLAQQAGVRGTPTFLVLDEGAIPGAVPLDIFREILDQLHARRSGS